MQSVPRANRLFVGTVTKPSDLALINDEHWYRVPEDTIRDLENWPPLWFAPWETQGASGGKGQQIRACWQVTGVDKATREQLFPDADAGERRDKRYWRLQLSNRELLDEVVPSTRRRQSVFIHTDVRLLKIATSVNDLWWNGPLETEFWTALKAKKIPAERQWPSYGTAGAAMFDFAVFCMREDIDIEVDGDQHHNVPEISRGDSRRDNVSQIRGFKTLRFDSARIRRGLDNCMQEVEMMIERCGGLEYDALLTSGWPAGDSYGGQLPLFTSFHEPEQKV